MEVKIYDDDLDIGPGLIPDTFGAMYITNEPVIPVGTDWNQRIGRQVALHSITGQGFFYHSEEQENNHESQLIRMVFLKETAVNFAKVTPLEPSDILSDPTHYSFINPNFENRWTILEDRTYIMNSTTDKTDKRKEWRFSIHFNNPLILTYVGTRPSNCRFHMLLRSETNAFVQALGTLRYRYTDY
nr:hypothetical protein [uncultured bacterium]AUH21336.1 hypothetical protein [uncultured bacterium]AUH21342.1 hypothetical protein [uncultured bacterium]AUH21348.1 hypothetical protein [uncultured bacterium]